MQVGVVGCGPIADSYVAALRRFGGLAVVACAGSTPDSASALALAQRYGLRAISYAQMLDDTSIDLILVLTPAQVRSDPILAAFAAGKHVYVEKPLALDVAQARSLLTAAAAAGRRLGCAPDTILGANVQRAAELLDRGDVGAIISGLAALGSAGMEHWHPEPEHLYRSGGGPVLDKGPYYVAALVTLLGAVTTVRADARQARKTRIMTAPGSPRHGQEIVVDVATSVHATLSFHCGAVVTLILSWDMPDHGLPEIELYGTSGALRLQDPNWFGGPVLASSGRGWVAHDLDTDAAGRVTMTDVAGIPRADHRGIGLAEMVDALHHGREPLCGGAFAVHVLEVLVAIGHAAKTRDTEVIPAPLSQFVLPRLPDVRARELLSPAPRSRLISEEESLAHGS